VMDISPGGARVTLPSDWAPVDGAALKILFSPDSDHTVLLQARVTRVASDHLGVEFCGDQSDNVRQLLQLLDNPG
ncbi:MAG: hypothetical protein JWL98_206, partial [Xanthomonadaceae bacterium]|nr:hypothetical protein [Xanthomonadaceae bacterium]